MFVKTMKFTKKTAVIIVVAIALIIAAAIFLSGSGDSDSSSTAFGRGVKTNADRIKYLSDLGWEVDEEPIDEKQIVIPTEFDEIYADYNDLQEQQGFDLSKYSGMELTEFTYNVVNYPVDDEVQAVLYIYDGKVVGGDIHSTALDGFMHGLK